jgi:hypothetical protein
MRCCVQVMLLKSLAVYFDCDAVQLSPGKRWDLITKARWDELLLPAAHTHSCSSHASGHTAGSSDGGGGITGPGPPPSPAAAWVADAATTTGSSSSSNTAAAGTGAEQQQHTQHQFLLCPVDGTLRYVRRGRQARPLETDAEQEVHLQLQQINVQLHQLQFQSSQKLLQEFDSYAASAPHRHLRPHCRPKGGALMT